MIAQHKRFFWVVLACFGVTLLPIFAMNLILLNATLGNNHKTLLASQWQQLTQGVTYSPTLLDTHLFKTLRLNDRMPEINTVVLGSSTAMGVTQQSLPSMMRLYNYAQSSHSLNASINEAEWLMAETDNIKYFIIPLDWAFGWIYMGGGQANIDISAAAAMQEVQLAARTPLQDRMRDAVSYPRIVNLMEILKTILRGQDGLAIFRGYFLQESSDEYLCADGSLARDFDIEHRGSCTGFRYDGSATFADREPVKDAQALIEAATALNSIYATNLIKRKGRPNPEFLRRLASLARQAERKGGKLLLFIPPLLPGMENAFIRHPVLSPYLMQTKQILSDWARRENVVIFDAGQSERNGCAASEFVDQHHALSNCYDKVFSGFWNMHTRIDDSNISWPTGGLYE